MAHLDLGNRVERVVQVTFPGDDKPTDLVLKRIPLRELPAQEKQERELLDKYIKNDIDVAEYMIAILDARIVKYPKEKVLDLDQHEQKAFMNFLRESFAEESAGEKKSE